jgi:hypothetical protein
MARPGAFLYYRSASYSNKYILVRTVLSTQEYTYIYGQPCSPFTRKHRFVARLAAESMLREAANGALGTTKLFDFVLFLIFRRRASAS